MQLPFCTCNSGSHSRCPVLDLSSESIGQWQHGHLGSGDLFPPCSVHLFLLQASAPKTARWDIHCPQSWLLPPAQK